MVKWVAIETAIPGLAVAGPTNDILAAVTWPLAGDKVLEESASRNKRLCSHHFWFVDAGQSRDHGIGGPTESIGESGPTKAAAQLAARSMKCVSVTQRRPAQRNQTICQPFTRPVRRFSDHRCDPAVRVAIWAITCSATSLSVAKQAIWISMAGCDSPTLFLHRPNSCPVMPAARHLW